MFWQTARKSCLARWRLTLTGRQYAAHEHIVNITGINTRVFDAAAPPRSAAVRELSSP